MYLFAFEGAKEEIIGSARLQLQACEPNGAGQECTPTNRTIGGIMIQGLLTYYR
jgi:hypothetical protein